MSDKLCDPRENVEGREVDGLPEKKYMLNKTQTRRRVRAPYGEGTSTDRWHAVFTDAGGNYCFRSAKTKDGILEALSDYDVSPNIVAIYEGKLHSFTEKRQIIL